MTPGSGLHLFIGGREKKKGEEKKRDEKKNPKKNESVIFPRNFQHQASAMIVLWAYVGFKCFWQAVVGLSR